MSMKYTKKQHNAPQFKTWLTSKLTVRRTDHQLLSQLNPIRFDQFQVTDPDIINPETIDRSKFAAKSTLALFYGLKICLKVFATNNARQVLIREGLPPTTIRRVWLNRLLPHVHAPRSVERPFLCLSFPLRCVSNAKLWMLWKNDPQLLCLVTILY